MGARAGRSSAASWSRSSATPGVGKSRLVAEALAAHRRAGSSAAAASPTARGSPTGRSSRWSSSSTRCPSDPSRRGVDPRRCSARATRARPRRRSPGRSASCSRSRRRSSSSSTTSSGASETFLDLVEGVALAVLGAPILLVCMARPELLDARRDWPVTLRLEPLPTEAVDELIARSCRRSCGSESPGRRRQSALPHRDARDGRRDGSDVEVPPTLRALLAARLDQLDPRGARRARARRRRRRDLPPRRRSGARARGDRRSRPGWPRSTGKELIRPDRAQLPGEDGFRFRHLSSATPRTKRCQSRSGPSCTGASPSWLEQRGADLVELDEILGYHLEQAHAYAAELGR